MDWFQLALIMLRHMVIQVHFRSDDNLYVAVIGYPGLPLE